MHRQIDDMIYLLTAIG